MANITQAQLQKLVQGAPPGTQPADVVRGLVARGHTIEGISDTKQEALRTTDTRRNVLEKTADFLGIEKVGQRVGSELVRFTKEGRDLKKLLGEGKISQQEYEQITTGGVSNKEAIGSGIMLGANLFGGAIAGKALGIGAKAGSATGAVRNIAAAAPTLGQATKIGAVTGAIGGVGAGLEQDKEAAGVIESAALGALIGAGIPLATKLVGAGLRGTAALARGVTRGAVNVGEKTIAAGGQKIADMTRARVAEQAGRIGEAKAIRSGVDTQILDFVQTAQDADKSAFRRMFDTAMAKRGDIRLQAQPKQVVGETVLDRVQHLVGANKKAGEAIGTVVKKMGSKQIDATKEYVDVLKLFKANGIGVKNGNVVAIGRVADADLPAYQKMLDYLTPAKNGKVLRTPQYLHDKRGLIFDELQLAKSRQQPYTDMVDKVAEQYRGILMRPLEALSPEYKAQNIAFAKTRKPLTDFVKLIGYKGKLEDIDTKSLRTAEVAQRLLGNAADRPTSVLAGLEKAAIESGYKPTTSVFDQILFSDLLENYFGTTQTRSLRGQVARAGVDTATEAAGTAADAARGNVWGLINRAIKFTTGNADEDQIQALGQLLKDETKARAVKALQRTAPTTGASTSYTKKTSGDITKGLRNVPPEILDMLGQ